MNPFILTDEEISKLLGLPVVASSKVEEPQKTLDEKIPVPKLLAKPMQSKLTPVVNTPMKKESDKMHNQQNAKIEKFNRKQEKSSAPKLPPKFPLV